MRSASDWLCVKLRMRVRTPHPHSLIHLALRISELPFGHETKEVEFTVVWPCISTDCCNKAAEQHHCC